MTNQRLSLRVQSPLAGSYHEWSLDTYFSGSVLANATAFVNLTNQVWACLGPFMANKSTTGGSSPIPAQLAEASLYSGAGGSPVFTTLYNTSWTPVSGGPAPLVGLGTAYTTSPSTYYGGSLATACLLEAPAGKSTKGKPVFLRKWVHAAPVPADGGQLPYGSNVETLLAPLTNGSLQNGLVATGPTGRGVTGQFVPYATARWHQLTRGKRKPRNKSSVDTSTLISALEAAAGLASDLG